MLGQQVIVENRPGASQIIGMQLAAKAPPDGYTLLFATVTGLATNVSAFRNLPYDPVRDFAPITLCFTTPLYLVVHPSLPVRSVKQLIALAKAQPGRLTFASGGHATTNQLAAELFKLLAGVDMLHVPYKSAAPAMVDVMAGHVSLMFARRRPQRIADRQGARPRRHHRPPIRGSTRRASRGRNLAGVRNQPLVLDGGARRHAGPHRHAPVRGHR